MPLKVRCSVECPREDGRDGGDCEDGGGGSLGGRVAAVALALADQGVVLLQVT